MANRVWVSGRTGQWNVASNWVGSTVPITSDTAIIGSGDATVTDGTNTIKLAMLGSYVAGNFNLATDGQGGTLVLDPPVSSGAGIATPPH